MKSMEHDTLLQLLKLLTAVAVSSGALVGLIRFYLRGKAKIENRLLDRQKEIEEQKERSRRESEAAVNTHVSLLKDSVIALSAEVRAAREIQAQQDKDISALSKTVRDLRDTVGALSNRIREFLASQVDSNQQRTIVRAKKG